MNLQPSGYEPDELPIAPPRDHIFFSLRVMSPPSFHSGEINPTRYQLLHFISSFMLVLMTDPRCKILECKYIDSNLLSQSNLRIQPSMLLKLDAIPSNACDLT